MPVTEGLLGTWDAADLPKGIHGLRLVVTLAENAKFEDEIHIGVELPTVPIVSHPAHQRWPDMDGGRVVYGDDRNGNWDIYLYDIATGTEQRITTDPYDQYSPAIDGTRIVYKDNREYYFYPDMYLYDLTTNTEHRITNTFSAGWDSENAPTIDGSLIVWADDRNGYEDIFLHDLTTNIQHQLTFNLGEQRAPTIDAGQIVWVDGRNGNWDLYMRALLGDLNLDGRLSTADALTALKMATGNLPPSDLADANQNGKVTATDALCILQASVGSTTLPCTTSAARSLTVQRAGTGTLAAPPNPTAAEQIFVLPECQSSSCQIEFPTAENVRFAVPQAALGSRFAGWSGACTGTGDCTVNVNAAKTLTATFTAIPNLLSNGEFESGQTGWIGWGSYKVLTTETVFDGTTAIKVLLKPDLALVLTHGHVPVAADQRYQASTALKTVNATAPASVRLIWRAADDRILRVDTFGATSATTAGWIVRTSPALTAPVAATKLQLDLVTEKGTGTAYFDGVRVEAR